MWHAALPHGRPEWATEVSDRRRVGPVRDNVQGWLSRDHTRKRGLIALFGAPCAAMIGFYFVGTYATRHSGEFDWELASIFGTAVGTLALAVATGALALTTARDVSATQQIAELGAQERADRLQPTVIGHVVTVSSSSVRVELRNVGLGAAVKISVTCESTYADVDTKTLASLLPDEKEPVHLQYVANSLGTVSNQSGTPPPARIHGNYRVTGTFLDRRGLPAGEVLDWVHS